MPIYEYKSVLADRNCSHCREGFEEMQRVADPSLTACPACGAPVERILSIPAIGQSGSSLDNRAKSAGFTKFKKLGRGEYEKQY